MNNKTWILVGLLLMVVLPVHAQSNIITLNETNPGIEVNVSSTSGTTGAIAVGLSGASVNVVDDLGNPALEIADERVHGVEIHFSPQSTMHTVTLEPLSNIQTAYVTVTSQLGLTLADHTTVVTSKSLLMDQEVDVELSDQPSAIHLSITNPAGGTLIALFPGAEVAAQVSDSSGVIVASLDAGKIDGLSLDLASGEYDINFLNTEADVPIIAAVGLVSPLHENLPLPVVGQPTGSPNTVQTDANTDSQCNFQVMTQNTEVRSGPGTVYSTLGFVFRGNVFSVGGSTGDGSWLLLTNGQASAWIDQQAGVLDGQCQNIPAYDVNVQQGNPPQISIQPIGSVNFNRGQSQ